MICYTNHALDQFLEYCISECGLTKGVVRVGGQSRSENLENFKLAKIKREMRNTRKIDANIHHRIGDERSRISAIKSQMDNNTNVINCLSYGDGILQYETLKDFMSNEHAQCFKAESTSVSDFNLLKWMGFFAWDEYLNSNDDDIDDVLDDLNGMSINEAPNRVYMHTDNGNINDRSYQTIKMNDKSII